MQIVKINQSNFCPMLVTSGVPQCSIVGLLFFILIVNDHPEYLTEGPNFGYFDDMKIVSWKNDSLRSDIESLISWCEENKVVLNSKKFKILSVKGVNSLEIYRTILQERTFRKILG